MPRRGNPNSAFLTKDLAEKTSLELHTRQIELDDARCSACGLDKILFFLFQAFPDKENT
jgi:hypothetical protein